MAITRLVVMLCSYAMAAAAVVSQTPQSPPEQAETVVRINTQLVQTDVMVFDKQGKFVTGLRPQDFELHIDGKPRPISFFELVSTGSANEESQLAAARNLRSVKDINAPVPADLDRGRVIFFYVDDLHLSPNNLVSARKVLLKYVDEEMRQNDEAGIASTSGQIGFLQQLTDNKTVLHAAIERLKARPYSVGDTERPAMTEYQALAIERNNRDVIDVFVEQIMKDLPALSTIAAPGGVPRGRAEQHVRDRAHTILQQAATIASQSLFGLESLVRSAAALPGRKLLFFLSDGFFLDDQNSINREQVRHVTSLAAHNSVVIYSIDTRGLIATLTDASTDTPSDPSGRLQSIASRELVESQDAMNALASDTGGRAIFNTNALDAGVSYALNETSNYYLLAWRPESIDGKTERFHHLEVNVVGRPDLTVRVRKGFFDFERSTVPKREKDSGAGTADDSSSNKNEAKLRAAIIAPFADRGLPVSSSLTWTMTGDNKQTMNVALQVSGSAITFEDDKDRRTGVVQVVGSVYDDQGKAGGGFSERLTVHAPTGETDSSATPDIVYNYPLTLPPGLYQVRIAVRDEKSGNIGSTRQWIEIPDLSTHKIVLSSLIVSERMMGVPAKSGGPPNDSQNTQDRVVVRVDHRFKRNSFLRFLLFIYTQSNVPPDIAVQIQVVRSDQPVITTSLRSVSTEGIPDVKKLPYAADLSLKQLPAGRYLLKVTAMDRNSKSVASESTRFEIE
ncbi:MAG TPA: VWA domain-containing protein [Pyrinomonadaceae bacterium]|nr:VWA domain-containing protein [Pyrinomonadaceae bacterium]